MARSTSSPVKPVTPQERSTGSSAIPPDPVKQRMEEIRIETMAKMRLESESKALLRYEREVAQEERDQQEAMLDAERLEQKKQEIQADIRRMSNQEFKKYAKRIRGGYCPQYLEDLIREREYRGQVRQPAMAGISDSREAEESSREPSPEDLADENAVSDE